MTITSITPEALDTILTWWPSRDDGEMPRDVLPPRGWCIADCTGPLAAAWLVEPKGSLSCYVDWMVTRPGLSLAVARVSCGAVIDHIEREARAEGYRYIFAATASPAMTREAQAHGYGLCYGQYSHLCKTI